MSFGILLQLRNRVAHGGEIDEERDAGEILQHDASDDEGNFIGNGRLGVPVGEGLDVVFADALSVEIAQHGLEDDADADGQFRDGPDARLLPARAANSMLLFDQTGWLWSGGN